MLFSKKQKSGIGSILLLTFQMKALLYKRGTGTSKNQRRRIWL